jgi:hypothetical protein
MRSVLLTLATMLLLGCASPSAAAPGPPIPTTPSSATATSIPETQAELLRYVGEVAGSTGYRHAARRQARDGRPPLHPGQERRH